MALAFVPILTILLLSGAATFPADDPELVEPELVDPELVEPELDEPELVDPVLVDPVLVELEPLPQPASITITNTTLKTTNKRFDIVDCSFLGNAYRVEFPKVRF